MPGFFLVWSRATIPNNSESSLHPRVNPHLQFPHDLHRHPCFSFIFRFVYMNMLMWISMCTDCCVYICLTSSCTSVCSHSSSSTSASSWSCIWVHVHVHPHKHKYDYIYTERNIFVHPYLNTTRTRGFVVESRYARLGTVSMTKESCSTPCSGTRGSKQSSRDLQKHGNQQETKRVCSVNSVARVREHVVLCRFSDPVCLSMSLCFFCISSRI